MPSIVYPGVGGKKARVSACLCLAAWAVLVFACGPAAFGQDDAGCARQGPLILAKGTGQMQPHASNPARARLMAVRAATVEARKNLLVCLQARGAQKNADISGIVKGAVVTDVQYQDNGTVEVTVTLDTSKVR